MDHSLAGGRSDAPSSSDWEFDATAADQFAAEFRPSWAPWDAAPSAPAIAPRPSKPPLAPPPPRGFDEPILVPGRRMKRRAAVLTGLSVASFLALAYWGVSSASKQGQTTELNSMKRSPTVLVTTPAPSAQDTPPPPAADERPQLMAAETPATNAPEAAKAEPTLAAAPAPTPEAKSEPSQAKSEPVQPEKIADTAAPVATDKAPTARAAQAAATPPPPVVASAAKNEPSPAANSGSSKAPALKTPQPLAAVASKPIEPPAPLHPRNPLLVVRALPEGSVRLWLDGQRMANPFDVRLPRDTQHKIEARGDGYEATSQVVRLESDAKLTFALRRVAPAHPAAPSVPAEHARNTEKRRGAGFVTVSPY